MLAVPAALGCVYLVSLRLAAAADESLEIIFDNTCLLRNRNISGVAGNSNNNNGNINCNISDSRQSIWLAWYYLKSRHLIEICLVVACR